MSRRKETIALSPTSEEKISQALYIIKDIEQRTKSIIFENNVAKLNFGGSRTSISLPSNSSFQIISETDLDNLNVEIINLKVN